MTNAPIFLDTNFLIASQIVGHAHFERTLELRNLFNTQKNPLFITPLVLDEFWYVFIGMWKNFIVATTDKDLHSSLAIATQNIFDFKNLSLLNAPLTKTDLLDTLKIIKKFKLKPKDALIATYMKKEQIKQIASFDEDFDKVSGITRIY